MAMNPDQFRLDEAEHQTIFEQRIKPDLFADVKPSTLPVAIIFGGQPGAGKSAAVDVAVNELAARGGAVQIIGDDLRDYHPAYMRLMRADDKTAAFYTDRDTGRWVEKAIAEAKVRRANIVIEGTMRDGDKVAATMNSLREAGYQIEARALAVPWRLSEQGIMQRYENQKADRGTGRMTTEQAHRGAYEGMLQTLERIEREKLADRVTIYRRGAEAIYSNEVQDGQWVRNPQARAVVEAERARPMTLQERQEYAKGFDDLAELLARPERQASAEEIQKIANLQRSAKAAVADAFDALRSEGDQDEIRERLGAALQRKSNLSNAAWRQAAGEPPPPLNYGLAERRNDQPQQDEPRPDIPQGNRQTSVVTAAATDENIVEAAEAVQSEQQAMLDGASVAQAYEVTLANYVEAKHNQVARLEDRLENLIEQQEARVQQTQANAPGMFSLPGTKRAWQAKTMREQARLQTLRNRLEAVREIRGDMGRDAPRIQEMATRRMRAENPQLASSWDAMREEQRRLEIEEQKRVLKAREEQRQTQVQSQSPTHGRGRVLSLSRRPD